MNEQGFNKSKGAFPSNLNRLLQIRVLLNFSRHQSSIKKLACIETLIYKNAKPLICNGKMFTTTIKFALNKVNELSIITFGKLNSSRSSGVPSSDCAIPHQPRIFLEKPFLEYKPHQPNCFYHHSLLKVLCLKFIENVLGTPPSTHSGSVALPGLVFYLFES